MKSGGNIHDRIASVAAAMTFDDIGTDNEMPTLDGLQRLYLKCSMRLLDMEARLQKLENKR